MTTTTYDDPHHGRYAPHGGGHSAPSEPPASGRAIAALVFGILGIVQAAPLLGPILAIALGSGEPSSAARAGRILGWITLVLYALLLFGALLFVGVFGGLAAMSVVV